MKILAITFVFGGISFFNIYNVTNGQHPEHPDLFYEPMTFDYTIRGGFNISECLKEMLTCFELVRADVICNNERHRESVCSLMRDLCHDLYGDLDIVWYNFVMYEQSCVGGLTFELNNET